MANELQHIADDQFHESIFLMTSHTFSWGPLTIEYSVDISVPQVTFSLSIAGHRIGGGTLNPQHPCLKVGGGVSKVKAEVELCIDVAKKQLTYDATLCLPIIGCHSKKGVLFSW
jgi:hypothetical protein